MTQQAPSPTRPSRRDILITLAIALLFSALPVWGARATEWPLVLLSGPSFWALTALCWTTPRARLLTVLLAVAWAVNETTSLVSLIEYNTSFAGYFAASTLATNPNEAEGMLFEHIAWVPVALALAAGGVLLARRGSRVFSRRQLAWAAAALGVFLAGMTVQYLVRGRASKSAALIATKLLNKTPLYNAGSLLAAHEELAKLKKLNLPEVTHTVSIRATGVDTYLLVVGESARRRNCSLHGYARKTTPRADAERARMLVFENAVAPAHGTVTAVPRTLCPPEPDGAWPRNYRDNILTLARAAGFKTFWLSNQEAFSPLDTGITGIAGHAHQTVWRYERFDGALLPALDDVLRDPAPRKLVILHLRGSHEPPEFNFPSEHEHFKTGDPSDDYDNSIRYTDHVLGEIFDRLRPLRASMFYYSDHALIRKKKLWYWKYRHGSGYKQAYEIPCWLWFAPPVAPPRTGVIAEPWSTGDNYHLLVDWLGVEVTDRPPSTSPLRPDWKPAAAPQCWETEKKRVPFASLPDEPENGG